MTAPTLRKGNVAAMSQGLTTLNGGLHQAALMLSVLGSAAAKRLSEALNPSQREALDAARRSLDELPPEKRHEMLAGLTRSLRSPDARQDCRASDDLPPRPLNAVGEDTDRIPCQASPGSVFGFLAQADSRLLCSAVEDERPAAIAQIIAHCPEGVAELLLAALPAQLACEVALLVTDLDPPAPGALRCMGEALAERLQVMEQDVSHRLEGVRTIARALSVADRDLVAETLTALGTRDVALAEAVVAELERLLPGRGGDCSASGLHSGRAEGKGPATRSNDPTRARRESGPGPRFSDSFAGRRPVGATSV